MSTQFHLLPPPGSIRMIPERPRINAAHVPSPWPAPVASSVKRSNVWPAPSFHTAGWAPPALHELAAAETVTVTGRPRRRWYQKINARVAVGTLSASAAAIAIAVALLTQF